MKVDDCYQIGHVIKTHGLRGEVQIFLDVDHPTAYKDLESMFVEQNNTLVPFFIEHIDIQSNKAIVRFEDIEDVEQARVVVSCKIYLPLDFLPALPDGDYYLHQLIGMELFDRGQPIGTVHELFEMGPQDLISVIHQGKEILIPVKDEVILKVDIHANRIDAELPNGLIDIYLEEDEN